MVPADELETRLNGEAASPFVYPNGEHLYVQALAPPSLLCDVDFEFSGTSEPATRPRLGVSGGASLAAALRRAATLT